MKISNIFMYISVIEICTQSINYYGTEEKKSKLQFKQIAETISAKDILMIYLSLKGSFIS